MYNKQTWLDEIPDMTKPIYDASGKQKTDPQTGRPLFELVQAGTRITSSRLNTMEGGIEAAHTLVEQLAKELGGNFVVPIDGTMGLLCNAQGLKVTWTTGIAYVGGRRYQVAAGEMPLNPTQGQYLYVDIDGTVKKTTSQATAKKGLTIFYVATDTSGVISTTDHRVNISLEEILKKLKDIDIEDAVTGGASGLMTGADAKFVRVEGETKTGAQEKADAVKDYVESRLDTSKRSEVTLRPGHQVIQGKRNAPFALTGLTGRALVNLLGVSGRCDVIAGWVGTTSTLGVDTTYKTLGDASLKITGSTAKGGSKESVATISLGVGKYYIAVGDVLLGTGDSMSVSLGGIVAGKSNVQTDKTKFSAAWSAYNVAEAITSPVVVSITSAVTSRTGYFDALRVYEISATEYAALDSMTPEQIAVKYPYGEGIKPVRNPYAIRYGENLLPPFYEWEKASTQANRDISNNGYELKITSEAAESWTRIKVSVVPNSSYQWELAHSGEVSITNENDNGFVNPYTKTQSGTFNSGSNKSIYFYVRNTNLTAGTYTFSNPMLTIGTTAKPFKPREDAMLALQTDLYADPATGEDADEVFEKDGQYFKLAKWKKVVLDGTYFWVQDTKYTGFRTLRVTDFAPDRMSKGKPFAIKYDGQLISVGGASLSADVISESWWQITTQSQALVLSVSNADSGWGDAYTPTDNEIKAYFLGWRMRNWNDLLPYTGTGEKAWGTVVSGGASHWTATLPTTQAVDYTTPYQLVYQLATPTVEPITSEGQLTLIEGNNQVEVGTGIVLRETVIPYTYGAGINNINDNSPDPKGNLTNKTNKILGVYVDRLRDFRWKMLSNIANANGGGVAQFVGVLDKSKSYSVTYLMLDTFPIASFVGSIAENEKALLADLNDIVQQGASSLSVVERSLSEALQALIQQQNKRDVWGQI